MHQVMLLSVLISVNKAVQNIKNYFKNNFHHTVTILLVAFLILKIPDIFKMYQKHGEILPAGQVVLLSGQVESVPTTAKKQVLVFWATWCGPCSVELGRIQNLVDKNKIDKNSILAISIGESRETVQNHVTQKKYTFPVAIDTDGALASLYEVNGTPTVFLVDENKNIQWMTVGMSPSLELRLKNFLGSN